MFYLKDTSKNTREDAKQAKGESLQGLKTIKKMPIFKISQLFSVYKMLIKNVD